MCGRASQKGTAKEFKENIYGYESEKDLNYPNIKPTQYAPVVINDGNEIKTVEARWWMQKEGSHEFNQKFKTFLARAESLEDSFLYKPAQEKRRCLIPVSSFYEWKVKGKPPVEIFTSKEKPFALAGLWSNWYENKEHRYSFTIITCEPNDLMLSIHNRMPVILSDLGSQELWLKKGGKDLLKPYESEMRFVQFL